MTMTPSLHTFIQALQTPEIAFATLTDARPVTEAGGIPQLNAHDALRRSRNRLARPAVAAFAAALSRGAGRRRADGIAARTPQYGVARRIPFSCRGELLWVDAEEHPQTCDLVLQHLPAGRSFAEALLTEPAGRLLEGLDALQSALRELGFSHNNLRADNLRWIGSRFIPLRYHDANFGTPDSDAGAFETLRRQVREAGGPMQVSDVAADYIPQRRLTGHRWTSHVFEGSSASKTKADSDSWTRTTTPSSRRASPGRRLPRRTRRGRDARGHGG